MKKNWLLFLAERTNTTLFFILIILYQLVFIFQGFDITDEGFYAVFYQQVYNDPRSVEYNFMYWFSGIIGGVIVNLFPDSGILGLRLAGVVVTTLTILAVYNLLKRYLDQVCLKVGLVLALLLISNDPKEIYYNNITALLFVLTGAFLFNGLKSNNKWKLFIAGVLIGLNTFTRIPNVLGLSLVLVIFYWGFSREWKINYMFKQALWFIFGFIIMAAGILVIMNMTGHLDLFKNNLSVVAEMGKSSVGTHGVSRMLILTITQYAVAISYGAGAILFLWVISPLFSRLYNKKYSKTEEFFISFLFILFCIVFTIAMVKNGIIDQTSLLIIVTGLSLIGGMLILYFSKNNELKLLALIGMAILVLLPLGSGLGWIFVGRYALWIILPVIVHYVFGLLSMRNDISVLNRRGNEKTGFGIDRQQLNIGRNFGINVLVAGCLCFSYYHPYFDPLHRVKMLYPIEHKYTKGIYTTKARAEVMNELIAECSKYIKKDDYILAVNNIPMVHYLTETKPYMRNSWPGLYESDSLFENTLNDARLITGELPTAIIIQKVETVGTGWPENAGTDSIFYGYTPAKSKAIHDFISRNNYKQVWENIAFKILIPAQPISRIPDPVPGTK